MQAAATSRSQRDNMTIVPPTYSGPFMLPAMPVTWKSIW
jgi:hypothetical protein